MMTPEAYARGIKADSDERVAQNIARQAFANCLTPRGLLDLAVSSHTDPQLVLPMDYREALVRVLRDPVHRRARAILRQLRRDAR